MFYKEILLTHKPYTLHTLSREMQRQSGITFSYNAARISPNQKIKVRDGKLTVEQLLALVKKRSGVSYKIVSSNHIVYVEGPKKKGLFARKKEAKKTKAIAAATAKAKAAGKTAPATSPKQDIKPLATAAPADTVAPRIVIIGDSSLAMSYYFSGGGSSGGAYAGGSAAKSPKEEWADPYQDLNAPATAKGYSDNKAVSFFKNSVLLAGGVSADEIYYFNPSVRAGFSFLYGTLSYNLGGSPHWRYGLGTSARISEKWNLHLAFNTGKKIPGAFNLTTVDTIPPDPPDSFGTPTIVTKNHAIAVQSRLSRFSLLLEYQLTPDLGLSAGATLNYLTTEYSSNGEPVTFNSFQNSTTTDPDKDFRIIKPPFLLGNSFDANNSSNTKIWIGFQLSLFYRIPFFGK